MVQLERLKHPSVQTHGKYFQKNSVYNVGRGMITLFQSLFILNLSLAHMGGAQIKPVLTYHGGLMEDLE